MNGTNKMGRFARKVSAYMEPENFVSYIDDFSDAARDRLVEAFSDVLPNTDSYSISQDLADLFSKIILEAAAINRSSSKEDSDEIPADNVPSEQSDTDVMIGSMKKALGLFAERVSEFNQQTADQIRRNSENAETENSPEPEPSTETTNNTVIQNQTNIIQNQTNIEHSETNNFNIENSEVTFNFGRK